MVAFDQSISLKANKNDFVIWAEGLKNEFLPIKYKNVLDDKIHQIDTALSSDLIERQIKFEDFLKETKHEFDQNMVKKFLGKFKKYE